MLDLEPEDTEDGMSGDLGVAALDERRTTAYARIYRWGPRDSENNGNRVESVSGTGTSTRHTGSYPLCRRPALCVRQIYKERNKIESGSLEINTY